MSKAAPLDDAQREAAEHVLELIEEMGRVIADEHAANVRVEKDRGGRFPYVTFHAFGPLPEDPG